MDHGRSYNHPCLIARTLDILGDRWTLLILRDLMAGLHRYNDILANCAGMSPNVLSDRLKRLTEEGLVEKHYYKELPPRTEYTLTEKGWAVRPILQSLITWGREYLDDTAVEDFPADFSVRVIPAFSFRSERAGDLSATMVVELADCGDYNAWSFRIHDGHLHPRRSALPDPDVTLRTTTEGFFRFIRGEAPPAECGSLEGRAELAAAIQACFARE